LLLVEQPKPTSAVGAIDTADMGFIKGSELGWTIGNVLITILVSLGLPRLTKKVHTSARMMAVCMPVIAIFAHHAA
jgi:hypothetical protein